jgi:glycosyltransferase involved in cell wall biosynthesis
MPDHIGGTELYTRALSLGQHQDGHQVAIFVPSAVSLEWPEPAEEDGLRIYRFPAGQQSPSKRFRSTFFNTNIQNAFTSVLNRESPDIVHIQHMMGLPVSLVDELLENEIPYIITLHDYWYFCPNAQLLTNYDNTLCGGPAWWLNCARCALARLDLWDSTLLSPAIAPVFALRDRRISKTLKGAINLIAPTPFVRDTYGKQGVNINKIVVVPHGIDPPGSDFPRKELLDNELAVGYIGGLSWQKGVHILVQAFNGLEEEGHSLSIWGDQTAFPEYVKELRDMALHRGIHFEGRLSREKLWLVLAHFDVVVVPSLWYETASLIVQEAFAAGVPVVASGIGALSARVNDGVDGLLVPPDDPETLRGILQKLIDNPNLLQQLRSGIQPVYTISEHTQRIMGLYSSATGG